MVSRFCQKKGPNKFRSSGNKLTISFTSDRTAQGEGAECTIACSDHVPTGQTRGSPHIKKEGLKADIVHAGGPFVLAQIYQVPNTLGNGLCTLEIKL